MAAIYYVTGSIRICFKDVDLTISINSIVTQFCCTEIGAELRWNLLVMVVSLNVARIYNA